jgi:hypothetical protein
MLTLWAVTVPTRQRLPCADVAVGALHEQLPGLRCAAMTNRIDGTPMAGQKL